MTVLALLVAAAWASLVMVLTLACRWATSPDTDDAAVVPEFDDTDDTEPADGDPFAWWEQQLQGRVPQPLHRVNPQAWEAQ